MYLVGILLAASTLSRAAYGVSTHRAMGYWAIGRSNTFLPTMHRLEWDQPEITFGGPWLSQLNSDLASVGEARLSYPGAHDVIAAGCATEDAHSRYFNHFLDGTTFQGLAQGFLGEPADVWGTNHASNIYDWEAARAYFVSALTERYPLDRERYRVEMLRSLGQVLHLIQDAHQPSHTRDDSHSHLAGLGQYLPVNVYAFDGYSALEIWAGEAVSMDFARLDPTVAAFLGGTAATYRPRIEDFIRGSAARTNQDFFSDDTIWQDVLGLPYPSPNGANTYLGTEGTWPFSQTYVFASSTLHNTLPPLKMARQRSGLRDLVDVLDPRRYTLRSPNDDVVRGNAAILVQRAVSECAGAINYFFRLGIEADIDTTAQPGEGRLKLTNISSVPGATANDLVLAAGATLQVRYETASGEEMLPIPGLNLPSMPALDQGASVTLPVDILGALQPLADPVAYPNPNVRARSDLRFVVVVQGLVGLGPVGLEPAVSGDVWSRKCPNNFPTPPGMVVIPAGSFIMGSDNAGTPYYSAADESPVHAVTISYCFWMGATEVTQAQYSALMGMNPSHFLGANLPVEKITWFTARDYCAVLTAQESALGRLPPGYEYRLPTEAEWEYACRAGTTTEFNVGVDLFCNQAQFYYSFHSNSQCYPGPATAGVTVPVASFAPNLWGLYDMHGNVSEWVLDSYAPYPSTAATDPFVTGFGPYRVHRGGNYSWHSSRCRSATRWSSLPTNIGFNAQLGFRVVLAPIRVP